MNTFKTLTKLMLFSIACCLGCSQPADVSSKAADSPASSNVSGPEKSGASQTPPADQPTSRMLPTSEGKDGEIDGTTDGIMDGAINGATDIAMNGAEDDGLGEATSPENTSDVAEWEAKLDPESDLSDEESIDADDPELPSEMAAKAFTAPDGATSISKRSVWVDRKAGRVYADGYIAMNDGPLEMFACPTGTKEHESVIATLAKASELHAGLLAVGAQVGTPASYSPNFVPATGQRIRVWVCYFDQDDNYQVTDARKWILKSGTEQTLDEDWVFAGSYIWTDPVDNQNYYQGDVGDMICVSNFTTAMLDIPVVSSTDTNNLEYSPNTPNIPNRGTAVRVILEPIPLPADGKEKPKALKPPTADVLTKRS